MSVVCLTVELPSHSHSFSVAIPTTARIIDVKQAIQQICTGNPRIDGQKLVWKGRFLADDEAVADIWKTDHEVKVVHLAVHPTAWSTTPPVIPPLPALPLDTPPVNPPIPPSPAATPPQRLTVFDYISTKHLQAMSILIDGSRPQQAPLNPRDQGLRLLSVYALDKHGYTWPTILDEPYPVPPDDMPAGVRYERTSIEGRNYLSLRTPLATPNILQVHALKVLTYTFAILHLPQLAQPQAISQQPLPIPAPQHVNQILHGLGLPPLRLVQPALALNPALNQNANPVGRGLIPELQGLQFRPLLGPLVMLAIRTFLLVYFISPTRKPVFGFFILVWIIYEFGWGRARDALFQNWRRQNANPGGLGAQGPQGPPEQPGQPPGQPQAQARVAQQMPVGPRGAPPPLHRGPSQLNRQIQSALNDLASINLNAEHDALYPRLGAPAPEEPTWFQRAITFAVLLILTLHPAIWNRRRALLRAREGRLRTEANAMAERVDGGTAGDEDGGSRQSPRDPREAQARAEMVAVHERRPRWVKEYVERVREEDWVDE